MKCNNNAFLFCSVVLLGSILAQPGCCGNFNTLAPHLDERGAIERGNEIGIGSALLEGPTQVEVLSFQTFTLAYAAGKAGIGPGGGIRVGFRHVHGWSPPQTEDSGREGYVTVSTSDDAAISVSTSGEDWFRQHFPWQHIVEAKVGDRGLREGDTIRIVYGDRSGGSAGIRVQPFDEAAFPFKVLVDPFGKGEFLPLEESPTVEVVASKPHRLGVVTPSNAVAGQPTWCIVRAEDRYGNPAGSYRGTVRFASSDRDAILPAPYPFNESDGGIHRFDDIVFGTDGFQSLEVKDGTFLENGNPVSVSPAEPESFLLWGDLHGHTLFSDGRGTVEEYYDFAENVAGLDFCAVSDHGFQIVDWMWEHSKKVTNSVYKPGRFVTFQAYEWSGLTEVGGDHNVYFLQDDPPLYRSRSYYDYRNLQMYHGDKQQVNHVEDLFIALASGFEDRTVFCIPHYGGRQGNPSFHNPKVQRAIEIFSEHRRSEDWALSFLDKGHRLGIVASTDDHYGNPGYGYLKITGDWSTQEIGMAAIAVLAKERTRKAVFEALYDRHVYATSGDRIWLEFYADGHPMGSEYESAQAPSLQVASVGTAPIILLEVKKNGEVVYSQEPNETQVDLSWQDPDFESTVEAYYYVRLLQEDGEEAISSPIWVSRAAQFHKPE